MHVYAYVCMHTSTSCRSVLKADSSGISFVRTVVEVERGWVVRNDASAVLLCDAPDVVALEGAKRERAGGIEGGIVVAAV